MICDSPSLSDSKNISVEVFVIGKGGDGIIILYFILFTRLITYDCISYTALEDYSTLWNDHPRIYCI